MNKMKAAKFFLGIATIALGLSLSSQAQDVFTNRLVVYYPFHGNANVWGSQNGELNGNVTPTANRFDQPGMACNFDGTAYVDVPDAEALHLQAMTLSLWVRFDTNYEALRLPRISLLSTQGTVTPTI